MKVPPSSCVYLPSIYRSKWPGMRRTRVVAFSLKDHLVRCPEYRHKVLVASIDVRLQARLRAGALHRRLEVMSDHLCRFVKNLRLAKIVNRAERAISPRFTSSISEFRRAKNQTRLPWSQCWLPTRGVGSKIWCTRFGSC
jgi:REP element-mobilizing transposase RayT